VLHYTSPTVKGEKSLLGTVTGLQRVSVPYTYHLDMDMQKMKGISDRAAAGKGYPSR